MSPSTRLVDDEDGALCEGAVPLCVVRPRLVVHVRRLGVGLALLPFAKTFNGCIVMFYKLTVIKVMFTKGTKVSNTIHKHHDHECHHFHIQSQNIRKVDRNKKPRSLILCYCYSMNALSIRKF